MLSMKHDQAITKRSKLCNKFSEKKVKLQKNYLKKQSINRVNLLKRTKRKYY